ncbi:MAG: tetratricopeptide repeat protein [Haliscomenobacter sp.]|uniref:tetratricopeptide repeat protein n=1 Tax=Haliscomenobacter sp. TaxID=2717303 RepID=UPI0029B99334|nr:tetratricopeptide repeat protein [Haliscomenobacter sp.]MDX2067506.1 tetratricopeptide repeat protein [Haliscomenobacter sp.]
MALQTYLDHIRTHIQKDELSAALQQLRDLLENSPKLDEVIQQTGRFAHIRKQIRLGTVHFEDATVTRNQISAALLELVSEIEKEGVKPELAGEVENAISVVNSKNVASGSFSAGGDIKIGDTTTHVHNYSGVEIPRLLTPPPFLPEIFLGRTEDLLHIHDLLFAPNGNLLLLVNGEGGVGKTSIASKYYHTYQEAYAHVAWVFKENSIADALLLLAMPLGVKFDEKWDSKQRLEVLLQAMANLKKPCLLIIDNANELNDLSAYLPQLQRCSNFHVLLTTRISKYRQAAFYKINPLPQEQALQAFKSHYTAFEPAEEALFFDIYAAVQGNTLVLELLAKNLNHFNNELKKHYLLADLKRDLEQSLLGLSKSTSVQTIYQGLREETPESIIAAMYDLGALPTEESSLLSVFAVLPAESIPFERLETLLPDHADLDTYLFALEQKGWIEYNAAGKAFKCSPVVQEVVRSKQVDLLENCQPLIDGLILQLNRENLHLDNYKHSSIFVRYAEALTTAFAQTNNTIAILNQNIGHYYTDTGELLKALLVYEKMQNTYLELSRQEPNEVHYKEALSLSYGKLGETHSSLGNLQQALTFFEEDIELSKELYAAYPQNVSFKNGLAISYEKLGQTHSDLGNLQQALTFFEEDIELSKELYAAYPQNVSFKNGLAVSYSKLGVLYRDKLGDLQKAKEYFQHCYALWKELSEAYPAYVEFRKNFDWAKGALGKE